MRHEALVIFIKISRLKILSSMTLSPNPTIASSFTHHFLNQAFDTQTRFQSVIDHLFIFLVLWHRYNKQQLLRWDTSPPNLLY